MHNLDEILLVDWIGSYTLGSVVSDNNKGTEVPIVYQIFCIYSSDVSSFFDQNRKDWFNIAEKNAIYIASLVVVFGYGII